MDGVVVTPLKQIEDNRGKVMHFLRSDWDIFKGFGEVYFSVIKQGKVKGWKKHLKMTQNLVCVVGDIKLILYDERNNSSSSGQITELCIGENNYCLVTIPPGIWVSFSSLNGDSILSNCASILHDPEEGVSLPVGTEIIPYSWENPDV